MARVTSTARHGIGERRLLDQLGAVLDPLAAKHQGDHPRALRPVLAQAWRTAFGVGLPEPALSRCVTAISAGQSWQLALWSHE
jgi:hypothetical protein